MSKTQYCMMKRFCFMGQAIAVDTISTVLGVIKPIAVNLNTDCTNKLTKDIISITLVYKCYTCY